MTASQFLIEQRNQLDRLCTYDIPLWIRAELKNNKFVHLEVKDVAVIKVDEEYRLCISMKEDDSEPRTGKRSLGSN